MRADTAAFRRPRAGHADSEYEDACHPTTSGVRSARRLRFAVSDGASESLLSGLWAQVLVRTWCRARRRPLAQVLDAARADWDIELAAYLEDRERRQRPIQWFEEPGLDKGAFATLLGLSFTTTSERRGHWSAIALGDTCMFQVRDGSLLRAFPLEESSAFGSTPKLVPSRPQSPDRVLSHVEEATGEWQAGDTFLLATDALAAWFLQEVEGGGRPWEALARLDPRGEAGAGAWIDAQRRSGALRNDDVTLLRVGVTT